MYGYFFSHHSPFTSGRTEIESNSAIKGSIIISSGLKGEFIFT